MHILGRIEAVRLASAFTPLIPTSWSILSSFLIFILGFILLILVTQRLGYSLSVGACIYTWHTLFCLAYAWYVTTFGGDATGYYAKGQQGGSPFRLGTAVIDILAAFVIRTTGTSFLGVSLAFSIAGAVGLLLLFDMLTSISGPSRRARRLVWPVVLLPSASFWTSGLGKDSIAFLAASLMTWAALDLAHRRLAVCTSVFAMFMVRPHIAGVMLAMLLVAAMGAPQGRITHRLVHGALVGIIITVALPIVTAYVGIDDATNLNEVGTYIENRQQYNQQGNAGVDISKLPLPVQVATYMYRPLPYEAWSLFAIIASVENLLFIALSGLALRRRIQRKRSQLAGRAMFLWLYLIGGTYILATTTANLGIAVRQKWMLMPTLLVLLFAALGTDTPGVDASPVAPTTAARDRLPIAVNRRLEPDLAHRLRQPYD